MRASNVCGQAQFDARLRVEEERGKRKEERADVFSQSKRRMKSRLSKRVVGEEESLLFM